MKAILHVQPVAEEMVGRGRLEQPVVVGDNRPSIQILSGTTSTKRAKHFDTKVKFAQDLVQQSRIAMSRVRTARQLADALTKPVPTPAFRDFRQRVMADTSMGADALRIREDMFRDVMVGAARHAREDQNDSQA
jgi:hypothetical protein